VKKENKPDKTESKQRLNIAFKCIHTVSSSAAVDYNVTSISAKRRCHPIATVWIIIIVTTRNAASVFVVTTS